MDEILITLTKCGDINEILTNQHYINTSISPYMICTAIVYNHIDLAHRIMYICPPTSILDNTLALLMYIRNYNSSLTDVIEFYDKFNIQWHVEDLFIQSSTNHINRFQPIADLLCTVKVEGELILRSILSFLFVYKYYHNNENYRTVFVLLLNKLYSDANDNTLTDLGNVWLSMRQSPTLYKAVTYDWKEIVTKVEGEVKVEDKAAREFLEDLSKIPVLTEEKVGVIKGILK